MPDVEDQFRKVKNHMNNLVSMFDNLSLMRKEHENLRVPFDYYNAKIARMNDENLPYFNNIRYQRNL